MALADLTRVAWALLVAGCGGRWEPGPAPHERDFVLECGHAQASCESCHPVGQPIRAVDDACASCHLASRPATHDPATTSTCEDCHLSACGWDSASPHPPGWGEPDTHGLAVKLGDLAEGDCRTCHGADLTGDSAQGCDDCHAAQGAPEWRTDCTFCHGGVQDPTGAPPLDLDGTSDPAAISFPAHPAHVTDTDGDYRALPCLECHAGAEYTSIVDLGHWLDDTPARAELGFLDGIAPATLWNGAACSTTYCHGQGRRDDGTVALGDGPLDCESCHATAEAGWPTMSGLHAAHLAGDGSITCNDCHAAIIDRAGAIATPARHVDGAQDVAFSETTISSTDGGGTCAGVCHGVDHSGSGWGHEPGYEAPELHGRDSNLQTSDCGACHGVDWTGGIAQGCDGCHATEGHADWRTDCTFCHGGELDGSGMPPQDIDDQADEASITFTAHPEHRYPTNVGHPSFDCDTCHLTPTDALSQGHALDDTPGVAEVTLIGGLSWEGGYDPGLKSCSNLYCHGNGAFPSGTVADGEGPLGCDDCHATTTGTASLSGTHATHLAEPGVTCADCHAPVVDATNAIISPDLHVNRQLDLDEPAIGFDPGTRTCTVSCHGEDHQGFGWSGPHPPGYDAPEQHGQEALHQTLDCKSCHGADLRGGSGQSCDDCHAAGWRSDCAWCHGGAAGDTTGLPPQDLDDQADEALITFKAHPEHADGDLHPLWGCDTCHGAGARTYVDAVTDPGHWWDSTRGVAEVGFTGLGAGTSYAAGTCSASYCHGNGQEDGSRADGAVALDCDGCHSTTFNLSDLSGTHARHLTEPGVTCADCHARVVDASGAITTPARHVNGAQDVDAATGFVAATETCTVVCHSTDHTDWLWQGGHPPGYDAPEIHGQEALFQVQDCKSCHGADLRGGSSGQGCDSCHAVGWKSDCTFCHGGSLGDTEGLPPSDLDNVTNEDQITFMAHPEHADQDDHLAVDCATCHGAAASTFVDALTDPNHWFDATPGLADLSFSGLAAGGSYVSATRTCTVYCHGSGIGTGTETDSATGLGCTSCHLMPPNSGEHRDHDHDDYPCSECHALTVDSADVIIGASLHVDGDPNVDMNAATHTIVYSAGRCTGSCHDAHDNESW